MAGRVQTRTAGFTLVEIMIVVAITAIVVAIAVPGWVRARDQSSRRACQENLQKIDGAKEQWALENKKKSGAAPPDLTDPTMCGPDGYLKRRPECPYNGEYTLHQIGTFPTCSQFPEGHVWPPPTDD